MFYNCVNNNKTRCVQYHTNLPTFEYSFAIFCFLEVECISWEELQLPSAKGYSWTGNTDVVLVCVNLLRTRLKRLSSLSLSLSFSSSPSSSSSPLSKAFNRRARNRLSTCAKKTGYEVALCILRVSQLKCAKSTGSVDLLKFPNRTFTLLQPFLVTSETILDRVFKHYFFTGWQGYHFCVTFYL